MSLKGVFLRALEKSDLEILIQLENDNKYWKYSNRTEPFSKTLLLNFIQNQSRDIFEVKQKRFVICKDYSILLGIVDLFDFEPLHLRSGVGIIIREEHRGKGYGKKGIELLDNYAKNHLNMHSLYANIAFENKVSLKVFKACGYRQIGLKKEWNFYRGRYHDEYLYQKLLK